MSRAMVSRVVAFLFFAGVAALGLAGPVLAGDTVERMEAAELVAMIDSPDIVIIDVRRDGDYDSSDQMIMNAIRRDYGDVEAWAGEFDKEQTVILYCA